MPHRLLIHSRRGNVLLAVLGATYVLAALTLMGILLFSMRSPQSLPEVLVEVILVVCAVEGCWLATTSAKNLRHH